MNLGDVELVIKELPSLVMYFVPGYLVLWAMGFVLSDEINKDNHLLLKSIVVSYILINFGNYILIIVGKRLGWDNQKNVLDSLGCKIALIISALLIGFVVAKIVESKWFATILTKMGIGRSINKKFFNDIIDLERGLSVAAYLPEEKTIYTGEIRIFEEKEEPKNTYLVLSNYCQYDYEYNKIDVFPKEESDRILLNTKNISRLELFYDPKSKKL